jgi:hypothetical protein
MPRCQESSKVICDTYCSNVGNCLSKNYQNMFLNIFCMRPISYFVAGLGTESVMKPWLKTVTLSVATLLWMSFAANAATIVENDYTTPQNTPLTVSAPGVGTGASGTIPFFQIGSPSAGSFSGLTTITTPTGNFCPCTFIGTTDGSFTWDPPSPDFTGTVNFIVQGALTNPPSFGGGGQFFGTNTLTDHIVVTAATTPEVTTPVVTTPLPAALPLFASGLVGLGLLGWRRKKAA